MYIQGSGGKMVAMYCNIQGDATETNEFSGTIETKPGGELQESHMFIHLLKQLGAYVRGLYTFCQQY